LKKALQQPSANIERLLQHSRFLNYLTQRVLSFLPAEFTDKISVLGFTNFRKNSRQGTGSSKKALTIAAISSAWANKLRFYTPALKRSLITDPQFSHLEKIIIKVAFSNITTKNRKSTPNYSKNSANIIKASAEHIENKALKESMLRLSSHVAKDDG
jgi:hypothetical protein